MKDLDAFATLVASKLDGAESDEMLFFGQYVPVSAPVQSFAEYMAQASADVDRQFSQRVHDLAHPPSPDLLTLKSWQHGFTAARSRDEAERARHDALFLRAQSYGSQRMSSSMWRSCLACFDRPNAWLDLAARLEAEGEIVSANAALAAARWLDAESTREAVAAHVAQRGELPARVVRQPDPEFRSLRLGKRHWRAWDMKNYVLVDLPSLLAFESDESFSVRTRIYRSLGQNPHPAAIQALREATLDPHPFARAQAVRSLGWCVDPTAAPLLARIAESDTDAEVRRTAEKARQRIVGYWTYFGEWTARIADPLAMVRTLVDDGLPYLALDILVGTDSDGTPESEHLYETLAYLEPEQRSTLSGPLAYHYWFKDAAREEEAWRAFDTTPDALANALEHGDEATRLTAMLAITGRGLAPPPIIARLSARTDATGWAARRVVRCAGIGTMSVRRISST
ncbi:MAG TPA: HEAT repeat domain-containing protein [Labilithrix sp.]|nr:HEAT repeat domain-containing protein [Labilithrix sp.]